MTIVAFPFSPMSRYYLGVGISSKQVIAINSYLVSPKAEMKLILAKRLKVKMICTGDRMKSNLLSWFFFHSHQCLMSTTVNNEN